MKYKIFYMGCLITLFLSSSVYGTTVPASGQNKQVEWRVTQNWPIPAKSLDIVHTLDGRFVYILTDHNQVEIYTSQGKLQGTIPVEAGTTAIDIAPRGERLYLINNKNKTFSSIAVSFVAKIDIAGSPVKGLADAPITLTIFTDFQ